MNFSARNKLEEKPHKRRTAGTCSSRKAKGRRACEEARQILLQYAPHLEPDDILVTSSGCTGEDLRLSPFARKRYPFTFEVKNQEKMNVWESLAQAKSHAAKTDHIPLLVFKRNSTRLQVTLDLEVFIALLIANEPTAPRLLKSLS